MSLKKDTAFGRFLKLTRLHEDFHLFAEVHPLFKLSFFLGPCLLGVQHWVFEFVRLCRRFLFFIKTLF